MRKGFALLVSFPGGVFKTLIIITPDQRLGVLSSCISSLTCSAVLDTFS